MSTYLYKIKSQHDSDFIIEMSQLPIKKFIKQLNKDFKQYQKDRKNYKQIYDIIELNNIEITTFTKCYGSQQFADDIFTKLKQNLLTKSIAICSKTINSTAAKISTHCQRQ